MSTCLSHIDSHDIHKHIAHSTHTGEVRCNWSWEDRCQAVAAASNSSESGFHTPSLLRKEASVSAPVTGRCGHKQQGQLWGFGWRTSGGLGSFFCHQFERQSSIILDNKGKILWHENVTYHSDWERQIIDLNLTSLALQHNSVIVTLIGNHWLTNIYPLAPFHPVACNQTFCSIERKKKKTPEFLMR